MKFNNPQDALGWAYEMLNGGGEYVDEAKSLLRLCERSLSALEFAYVKFQFGGDLSGIESLTNRLDAIFGPGSYNRNGIEQIIRAYCGSRVGLREIRKTLNTGMLKAASMRNRGYDCLDAIHDQAMEILSLELAEYFEGVESA